MPLLETQAKNTSPLPLYISHARSSAEPSSRYYCLASSFERDATESIDLMMPDSIACTNSMTRLIRSRLGGDWVIVSAVRASGAF